MTLLHAFCMRRRADAAHARGSKELADDLHKLARRIEAGELISDKSMSDREFLAPLLEDERGN